eukprot:1619878-Prymnesium_polylepis.1
MADGIIRSWSANSLTPFTLDLRGGRRLPAYRPRSPDCALFVFWFRAGQWSRFWRRDARGIRRVDSVGVFLLFLVF